MTFSRRMASALLFGLLIFIVGCMGPGSRSDAAELDEDQKFTLPDLSGNPVSLEALLKQNKAVLVNFWATWCPPCREEIPNLIKLHEQYKDKSFTVLGVEVGESVNKVSGFAKKNGIRYPIVLDQDQSVAEKYKIVGIPTTLLIGPGGKILGEYHAYTPELVSDVEKALQ